MTGRFAPSPTGPLHLGSLLAAAASYLDAHSKRERWLLRIDDLDVHRNVPGATDQIMTTLDAHGLHWDGPIVYQSTRIEHYQQALQSLERQGLTFYCRCSRRQLKGQKLYPGTCRDQTRPLADAATRIRVKDAIIEFDDFIQGRQRAELATSTGDFVVRRRDGLVAYQLATAVDDGAGVIDSVVRGADLLDNTARQIYLMQVLGLKIPDYAHVPMLTHPDGSKLSKQTFAAAVNDLEASANLVRTFEWLGMQPPADADGWSIAELIDWGTEHWVLANVPRLLSVSV